MPVTTCPEFMCDALEDLTSFEVCPPVVGSLHPYMAAMWSNARRQVGYTAPEMGGVLDGGFLLAVHELAPELFADVVAWRTGATPSAQRPAYKAVKGARNAMRHTLYQTGVL